ncbi:transglutaminase-like cysteine peptidase [Sphingomonas oleivorans]|nr:transglutaminase-like cysteine peptidase [Sphingomonas oleivorans]
MAASLLLSACAANRTAEPLRDGGIVLPPRGWMDYCRRNASDPSCKAVRLDAKRWRQLEQAQRETRRIPRRSDRSDHWEVARGNGADCEDIALAARERLHAEGWPLSSLRLATAWTERGDYHVVLTVDVIEHGRLATYVLDSRFTGIVSSDRLERLGYRFHMRQASRGPHWVVVTG